MKNKVELVGIYGDDLLHSLAAWTSTSRELTEDKKARIPKLLTMLVDGSDGNAHGTPFERSMLHFLITTDVATHIQLCKHRAGVSANSESARYKELKEDKFMVPQDWPEDLQKKLAAHTELSNKLYHQSLQMLVDGGMDRKRAKESARFFKTYNSQIDMDISFNFRSFAYFQKLRNAPGAQKEIRGIAEEMLRLVRETGKFEHSLKAWKL